MSQVYLILPILAVSSTFFSVIFIEKAVAKYIFLIKENLYFLAEDGAELITIVSSFKPTFRVCLHCNVKPGLVEHTLADFRLEHLH